MSIFQELHGMLTTKNRVKNEPFFEQKMTSFLGHFGDPFLDTFWRVLAGGTQICTVRPFGIWGTGQEGSRTLQKGVHFWTPKSVQKGVHFLSQKVDPKLIDSQELHGIRMTPKCVIFGSLFGHILGSLLDPKTPLLRHQLVSKRGPKMDQKWGQK